jgi:hypothetical protein
MSNVRLLTMKLELQRVTFFVEDIAGTTEF